MANREFYIQPADYGSGWREGAAMIGDYRQKQDQQAYQEAAKKAATEAMQSGDPRKIREAVIQFPEIAKTMTDMFGFTNDQTKQVAKEAYRKALSDPQNAGRHLQDGISQVTQFGGRPNTMAADLQMFQQNPEAGLKNMRVGYAGIASEEEYGAMFGEDEGMGGPTPAAIRVFEANAKAAGLEPGTPEYIRAAQIELGLQPRAGISAQERIAGDPSLSTQVAASGAQQAGASEGARLGAQLQVRPAIEGAVTTARATAENQAEATGPAAQQAARMEIESAKDTIAQIDNLTSNNDYMNSITGIRGKLKPIPGTPGFDAEVAFNQFKDSLTLENLGKMSGVLTDRDIQLLSSAASGLEMGMSREAMESRFSTIRSVLSSKSESAQKKIAEMMGGSGSASDGPSIMVMSASQLQALNPADLSDEELKQAADRYNQIGGR